MGSDISRRRVRRSLTAAGTSALLAIGFTAGFDTPAVGASGPAAAPPGPYSASAHGDIVDLDVDLLAGDLRRQRRVGDDLRVAHLHAEQITCQQVDVEVDDVAVRARAVRPRRCGRGA